MFRKKAVSIFFLFSFCVFLATPCIITLIEKNTDLSVFYSMNEEEKESPSGKLTDFFQSDFIKPYHFVPGEYFTPGFSFFVMSDYSNVTLNLLSPPPEDLLA